MRRRFIVIGMRVARVRLRAVMMNHAATVNLVRQSAKHRHEDDEAKQCVGEHGGMR